VPIKTIRALIHSLKRPGRPDEAFTGRGLRNVWLWTVLGLVGMFLFWLGAEDSNEPQSPLAWLAVVFPVLFLLGLYVNTRKTPAKRWVLPSRWAAIAYISLAWFAGMSYELTLSASPGNIGGCHDDTFLSFILAQLMYLPFIVIGLLLVRRHHLGFCEMFIYGGGASFGESMLFRPMLLMVLLSPFFFFAPFVLGYYVLVYGLFTAFPLLFIDERTLWSATAAVPLPLWKLIVWGVVAGFISSLVFGIGGSAILWFIG
jgi:hypothetical protein